MAIHGVSGADLTDVLRLAHTASPLETFASYLSVAEDQVGRLSVTSLGVFDSVAGKL